MEHHKRHDHDDMGGGMGSMDGMSMSMGSIDMAWLPQVYWIFIGSAIGVFAATNLFTSLLYWQRLRAKNRQQRDPARPHTSLTRWLAASTALCRETANVAIPLRPRGLSILGWTPQPPSFGSCLLLAANIALLLGLGFYRLDPTDTLNYQDIAYRWGYLTLGQIPLLFLLAGKENIIGFFTGHSYERLNWLHRWAARCVFLTATLHMAFWFADWAPYDYIGYQIKNDKHFTQTGFAAWCVLLWLVISTVAPVRRLSYELFFLQHFLSFVAFMALVFLHTPTSAHVWLWIPIGLFFFDRLVRWTYLAVNNLAIVHSKTKQLSKLGLACHAELTPLPGRMTRITISNPPIQWRPGQHVHLSAQSINPLQTHPFTIASLPSDGKMEFVIKAHKGGTRKFFDIAEKRFALPVEEKRTHKQTVPCLVSRPYGSMRQLRQFDSVVLLAGSTGGTFTTPLLRDIVRLWRTPACENVVTRRIRFVWVVKSGEHISWFAAQLRQALLDVQEIRKQGLDVRLHMSIYVTCDESFTADWSTASSDKARIVPKQDVQIVSTSSDGSSVSLDEKRVARKATQEQIIREVDPRSDSSSSSQLDTVGATACRPDGTCCCQTTVTDEKTAPNFTCSCNCAALGEVPPEEVSLKSKPGENDPIQALAKEDVNIISGRPHPKTIIRRTLEQARGESAVVVCGPQSLNHDVRQTVVRLSDERAAGRSTGALGVWFWGEGFGY